MNKLLLSLRLCVLPAVMLVAACGSGEAESDAYGNFEADEVLISAEASGQLLQFDVQEGENLRRGATVGLIDTVQLALQRQEIAAGEKVVRSRARGALAEIQVLEAQLRTAERERARLAQLVRDSAAPSQQLDEAEGQVAVLQERIAAVRTQNASVLSELDVSLAKRQQVGDRLSRSRIVNPVAGTVLQKYAERYELTAPGKPLYRIAPLDTLTLRAYFAGGQVSRLHIGQRVHVRVDSGATGYKTLPGTITWIASRSEFTPRAVQTKEERVTHVYAVKIRVPNASGLLKIGMPGEVLIDEP